MPHKKKRAFTKTNSVKYLLLHGHENAENADGETLGNILVPVSNNYKPGSTLLMSRMAELVNESNPPGRESKEPDLGKIMEQFEDASDSEEDSPHQTIKDLKNLKISDIKSLKSDDFIVEEEFEDDEDSYSDFSGSDADFSDSDNDDFSMQNQHRPENLKILEERMKTKLKEYEDDQLGALDDEEICGYLTNDNDRVNNYIDPSVENEEEEVELGEYEKSYKEKIFKYCEEYVEDCVKKYEYVEVVTGRKPEFDCESIISTYSNKYNHPTVIKEAKKVKKIKIPNNPLKKHLTKSELKQLDFHSDDSEGSDDNLSIASTINIRPKGETPEQKKERKNLFKEAKRESRILKKENKIAFKTEKKLQKAQSMNSQNCKGIRLQ